MKTQSEELQEEAVRSNPFKYLNNLRTAFDKRFPEDIDVSKTFFLNGRIKHASFPLIKNPQKQWKI